MGWQFWRRAGTEGWDNLDFAEDAIKKARDQLDIMLGLRDALKSNRDGSFYQGAAVDQYRGALALFKRQYRRVERFSSFIRKKPWTARFFGRP